ncbi:receptor-like histidine kinase [Striga asiatica]|uniref:Receptor-like histidine kinase n=1 Tax=Striga asiatica TaxID=4170 RepID=A0A5A7QJ53_STRAF|nr:receptor-like histidine kinase [Striga asiatica]
MNSNKCGRPHHLRSSCDLSPPATESSRNSPPSACPRLRRNFLRILQISKTALHLPASYVYRKTRSRGGKFHWLCAGRLVLELPSLVDLAPTAGTSRSDETLN